MSGIAESINHLMLENKGLRAETARLQGELDRLSGKTGFCMQCEGYARERDTYRAAAEGMAKAFNEINIVIAHNGQWMKTMEQEPRPTIFFVQDKAVEALAAWSKVSGEVGE